MTESDIGPTWVIIPVHNRRDTTLRCLEHLQDTQAWSQFEVLVVDDGSTDGTGAAIRADYPDVTVLEGDGSLWWGGAMRWGMEYAKEQGAEVFVWLNDDVLPEPDGVQELASKVSERGETVLTTMVEPETDDDYTTRNRKTRWGIESMPYEPETEVQHCDVVAGKFTAFPRRVVDAIGLPNDERFPHHYCDYDYTLRAKEHGFDVGVYSEVTARDTAFSLGPPRLSSEVSVEEVAKNTFYARRHASYSIRTTYYQYIRFCGPPRALAYPVVAYRVARSVGAILIKFVLALTRDEQPLRSPR